MDFRSIASFADEMVKISELSHEQKEKIKRYLGDAAVGSIGFGAGYGLGSAAGRMLADKYPQTGKMKYAPLVAGALGAGRAVLAKKLWEKRKEYLDKS